MKGTSGHGACFFAEAGPSFRSLPGAHFFTRVSTRVTVNAGDEMCLQCPPTNHYRQRR